MSYRVIAAQEDDFAWLKARTTCALTDDFNALKAIDASGAIHGMVGYCDWSPSWSCATMHMAVDSAIVWRSLLAPAGEYPFEEVGAQALLGFIPANNKTSNRFAEALGFKEVHRVREGAGVGVDLVVRELRREVWRAHKPLGKRLERMAA